MLVAALLASLIDLAGCVFVVNALPYAVTYAPNQKQTIDPAEDPGQERLQDLGVDAHLRATVGPPEASLSCFVIEPREERARTGRSGTIFVLHGITDNKVSSIETGKWLAKEGFRAVLVDHRGHGRSSGKYATYGVVESRDMVQLLDALIERKVTAGPIGVIGNSYGGAVALQWAARDARVGTIVSVSTFSSLRAVLGGYVRHHVPILGRFISERQLDDALAEAGRLAEFDPAKADNMAAIRATHGAVLLIHGAKDQKIPVQHAERLYEAARSRGERVRLVVVPDGGHDSLPADVLRREISAWLRRWAR